MRRAAFMMAALGLAACGAPDEGVSEMSAHAGLSVGAALTASCSGCHAPGGSAITDLSGWTEADIKDRLTFYRADEAGSTVMHRLARGYTDAEIEVIAAYLSSEGRQ